MCVHMLILATVVAMNKYENDNLKPHWNDGFVGLTRDEIIERSSRFDVVPKW